jgi:hypothetical protein
MVNNSTNINKTNNHSSQIIKKRPGLGLRQAHPCEETVNLWELLKNQTNSDIVVVFLSTRNKKVLSTCMPYHWVYNKNNTTDVTCFKYPSGEPAFTPGF